MGATMSDIEKQYARLFSSYDGQQVLAHLQSLTISRVFGSNISNENLRWWAAQCALVHQIESLIKKGNNPT